MSRPVRIGKECRECGETREVLNHLRGLISKWECAGCTAVVADNDTPIRPAPRDERLVAFLYILLRDHLPSGVVEKIMLDHAERATGGEKYSNPHGEAHARELVERLLVRR